jgi:thiol-disulfide isomerase/thioredoxin
MMKALVLGAVIAVTFFSAPTAQETAETGSRVGNIAIDFALNDLDGNEVVLSDHFGKVIVLTFWDWGCIECREKSMPELQKLVLDVYGSDRVSIFAINVEQNPDIDRMKQYVEEKEITYHILLQGMQLAFEYRVYAIPILLVLDKDGVIQYREHKALEDLALETIADLVEDVVVEN